MRNLLATNKQTTYSAFDKDVYAFSSKESIDNRLAQLTLTLGIILLFVWLAKIRAPYIAAYDDCYMAHYEDWSVDCELGFDPTL